MYTYGTDLEMLNKLVRYALVLHRTGLEMKCSLDTTESLRREIKRPPVQNNIVGQTKRTITVLNNK